MSKADTTAVVSTPNELLLKHYCREIDRCKQALFTARVEDEPRLYKLIDGYTKEINRIDREAQR